MLRITLFGHCTITKDGKEMYQSADSINARVVAWSALRSCFGERELTYQDLTNTYWSQDKGSRKGNVNARKCKDIITHDVATPSPECEAYGPLIESTTRSRFRLRLDNPGVFLDVHYCNLVRQTDRLDKLMRAWLLLQQPLLQGWSDPWINDYSHTCEMRRQKIDDWVSAALKRKVAKLRVDPKPHRVARLARALVLLNPKLEEELYPLILADIEDVCGRTKRELASKHLHTLLKSVRSRGIEGNAKEVRKEQQTSGETCKLWLDELASELSELSKGIQPALMGPAPSHARIYVAPTTASTEKDEFPTDLPTKVIRPTPVYGNGFFGRQSELRDLSSLLTAPFGERHRVITITGPGGSGKTRLATEVATAVGEHHVHAICYVPLAEVSTLESVLSAIAESLGVPVAPQSSPRQQVILTLGRKPHLLVLDNLEHLIDDAANSFAPDVAGIVSELISRVPHLTCLVTSRRPLGLNEEYEYFINPLPVPHAPRNSTAFPIGSSFGKPDSDNEFEEIASCPSVQLFVSRAQAKDRAFNLVPEQARAVAQLCVYLEGMPIAIELVAAGMRGSDPETIRQRLSSRLDLPENKDRYADLRYKTLRGVFDWGIGLLGPETQQLFAQISVFTSGFTSEAVQAVTGLPAADVERHLYRLLEYSLVTHEDSGAAHPLTKNRLRFRMLEIIREYGAELIEEQAQTDQLALAHLNYYVELAQLISPKLKGRDPGALFDFLAEEYGNITSAVVRAKTQPEATERAMSLVSLLWRFYEGRGRVQEGIQHLLELLDFFTPNDRQLETTTAEPENGFASFTGRDVLSSQARQDVWLAASRSRRRHYEKQAKEEPSEADNDSLKLLAAAAKAAGALVVNAGNYRLAWYLYRESLVLSRKSGDIWPIAAAYGSLATAAERVGRHEATRRLRMQSLELFRSIDADRDIAIELHQLSRGDLNRGDLATARNRCEEAFPHYRKADDMTGVATALRTYGLICALEQDLDGAYKALAESLEIWRKQKEVQNIARCLEGFSLIATQSLMRKDAVILYASATALRAQVGTPMSPVDCVLFDPIMQKHKERLGEQEYASLYEQGSKMNIEDAIKLALHRGQF